MTDVDKLRIIRAEYGPVEWRRTRFLKDWRLYRQGEKPLFFSPIGEGQSPIAAIDSAYDRLLAAV